MKLSTLSILALFLAACSKGDSHAAIPPTVDTGNVDNDTGIPDSFVPDLGIDAGGHDAIADGDTVEVAADTGAVDAGRDTFTDPTDADLAEAPGPLGPPDAHTAPLSACTKDTLVFGTSPMMPIAPTSKNMGNAWVTTVTPITGGEILVKLTGLTSNPLSVTATIGSTDGNAHPALSTFAKSVTIPLDIDSITGSVQGSLDPVGWELKFPAAAGSWDLEPGNIGIQGIFDTKACASFTDMTIAFNIPMSAAAVPFAGSTVGALFGPNSTGSIGTGSTYEVAWAFVLEGPAYSFGGSP